MFRGSLTIKNFDTFVAIDWSGAKAPVRTRSIALAVCRKGQAAPLCETAPLSRTDIAEWLEAQAASQVRTLVGIDCNFGYAHEIGRQQFGPDYTYLDLWRQVEESSQKSPNYFAQGFWQHPDFMDFFWISGKRPAHFPAEIPQRITEKTCARKGYGHPESPFKLIGAKQVGKGGLAGMRLALDLKRKLGREVCIWPFEDHADDASLVIAEIYPRLFLKTAGMGSVKIREQENLNKALLFFKSELVSADFALNDHIADAVVASAGLRAFAGSGAYLPEGLIAPQEMTAQFARTEGWIFGV